MNPSLYNVHLILITRTSNSRQFMIYFILHRCNELSGQHDVNKRSSCYFPRTSICGMRCRHVLTVVRIIDCYTLYCFHVEKLFVKHAFKTNLTLQCVFAACLFLFNLYWLSYHGSYLDVTEAGRDTVELYLFYRVSCMTLLSG